MYVQARVDDRRRRRLLRIAKPNDIMYIGNNIIDVRCTGRDNRQSLLHRHRVTRTIS